MAGRRRSSDDASRITLVLFLTLVAGAVTLFAMGWILSAPLVDLLRSPLEWSRGIDRESASGALETAAEVTAGVLAIAMTVVAIVVELAATRYSHRITFLFIRSPVNAAVLGLFVLTTVQCLWMAISVLPAAGAGTPVPNASFAATMGLVSLSLLVLLPYFALVLSFISPLNVVRQLGDQALRALERVTPSRIEAARDSVVEAVDELQDVARAAVEQGDRSIAMACVDALEELVCEYQELRDRMPEAWHQARAYLADEPDFVSLAPSAMDEAEPIWLEVKVLRQYLSLLAQATPRERDVANLIAIRTRGVASGGGPGSQPGAPRPVHPLLQQLPPLGAERARPAHCLLRDERIPAAGRIASSSSDGTQRWRARSPSTSSTTVC